MAWSFDKVQQKSVTQYRLLAKAQIDGAVREPGYVFTLPEGVRGPHRTVIDAHDMHDPKGGERIMGKYRDIPLYEEVK